MNDKEILTVRDLHEKREKYLQKKGEELLAALSPAESSRALHNKELSVFKDSNHIILEELLKLLDSVDIYHLKRTGSFFKFHIKHFSNILRPYKVDYEMIGNRGIMAWLRCGALTKLATLEEYWFKIPTTNCQIIAHFTLNRVILNIDKCVSVYIYIWKHREKHKIEELRIDACHIQDWDSEYPDAPSPFYYFYMILHMAAARIIRIRKSLNLCSRANLFLNNSSMENTERVFFSISNTRLHVEWKNIHQMLIHIYPNNITIEWRNPNFLPRNKWNAEDEKMNLLEWMEKNIENVQLPDLNWESKITIPLEQGTEIKQGSVKVEWNTQIVYLIGISYE